jgi:geranylgeranyl diphosphate synthase, type II
VNDFVIYLDHLRTAFEATLERLLPPISAPPVRLHEALRYSVFAGGKRLRPALVALAGESFGGAGALSSLLEPGAALEMIHTYSLIHDDLPALDNDDLRRGRPTVHRAFDEATAILAGDALLTLGLRTLAAYPETAAAERRRRAVEMVADAIGTGGMIGGQVADLEAERGWPEDPALALAAIHRRKTGALLAAAVRLGGLHAGADAADDALLGRLGESLGLLFQIGDDILDVVGEQSAMGKSVGKDARAAKLTYPALFGLEPSRRLLRGQRDQALALSAELPDGGQRFQGLIEYLAGRDR